MPIAFHFPFTFTEERDNSIGREVSGKRKDGTVFPLDLAVSEMKLKNKKMFTGIVRDITERKKAEEERFQKEKLQGVLEMAGATCHEFNQPMQVISGYAELLLLKITDDNPLKKQLRIIKQQIDRMGELTRKLQNITKYETMQYVDSKIIDIDKASK